MLIKACNIITHISNDDAINKENYMEGLNYIENLYKFLNRLKLMVSLDAVEFLPSFKGKYIVEKLGIASSDKENEMKIFIVKSPLFLEDTLVREIAISLDDLCEEIKRSNDELIFSLK